MIFRLSTSDDVMMRQSCMDSIYSLVVTTLHGTLKSETLFLVLDCMGHSYKLFFEHLHRTLLFLHKKLFIELQYKTTSNLRTIPVLSYKFLAAVFVISYPT